jgi:glutamate-5-semialdehyde dehydrogenase
MSIREQAQLAVLAERQLAVTSTKIKNQALNAMAEALLSHENEILAENAKDLEAGKAKGMRPAMLDRLLLNHKRISEMAEGLNQVAELPDPVGNIVEGRTLPNGLTIMKTRTPLGVIGIIYEARPNVTADAIGLCLKSGNAVVLKGGSEALRSNTKIAGVLAEAAEQNGIPQGSVQFITSTDHEAVQELISLRGLIDVVIPRGGARLIHAVVENAKVPVIETGLGVCHTYVDAGADYEMAARIAINAKVQRPAVCNSMETLLVHKDAAGEFLPEMLRQLQEKGVTVLGDESTCKLGQNILPATEEDWATEYDDLRLSVKVVNSLDEAIDHIARYGTRHSECIVTRSYENARKFQHCVDAAAVYVNASTRFTDGFQYGFGAEIGISTQKLHTRGPMALPELTTYKYLINGDGQIRE